MSGNGGSCSCLIPPRERCLSMHTQSANSRERSQPMPLGSGMQRLLYVAAVLTFTVLALVVTIVHRGRFHFLSPHPVAQFAAWVWLAIYVAVPAISIVFLAGSTWPSWPASWASARWGV